MIIVLNGYPGVGKMTIGAELADLLGGRMLDIHSVYNVAIALTEFKSPEFIETVERIEAIAHELIRALPAEQPVVLTTVLTGRSEWADRQWDRIVELGRERPPFQVVHVACDLAENERRIASAGRAAKRKLRDPEVAVRNQTGAESLRGLDATHLLTLDTTSMTAGGAADEIAAWATSA